MIPENNFNTPSKAVPSHKPDQKKPSSSAEKIEQQQSKIAKAKEAEDIPKLNSRVKKSSAPTVEFASKEAREPLKNKDSVFWECIGRKPGKDGGYIFSFKLRDVYDRSSPNFDSMKTHLDNMKILPADEYGIYILNGLPKSTREENPETAKSTEIMRELGYLYDQTASGTFLHLPDKEYLEATLEKLSKSYPNLPVTSILISEGIAADTEFTEAHLLYDNVLSNEKEFIHDHLAHIYPSILANVENALKMQEENTPVNLVLEVRKKLRHYIVKFHKKLEIAKFELENEKLPLSTEDREKLKQNLPRLKACLSTQVDTFTSNNLDDLNWYNKMDEAYFNSEVLNRQFSSGFKNIFSQFEPITQYELEKMWAMICEIEKRFLESRGK